ncbi:MAG: serine/threonine protein kinase, partial [Deltaproteobacteria bacterium]|nr:serine/threonine protein kinase [Deltaproteobacteria bacterium]
MASPSSGTKLDGQHTLVRVLDEGGMSIVWLAEHGGLGKQVAVKILRAEQVERDPSLASRFVVGAEAASKVGHPHLVSLVAHGTTDAGAPWLSMERLEGMSLRARLELGADSGRPRARVPLSYALAVLEQAAQALDAAHAAGLAHLALSPAKLFVTDAGGAPFVKLFGLGLGKLVDPTRPGGTSTALPYLAPEQLVGAASVDAGADVWALAVMAYELLTGQRPFSGANASALYVATVTSTPAAPSTYDPGLGPAVDALFTRAFARSASARFGSAGELARALVAALTGGSATVAVAPVPQLYGESPKPTAPTPGPALVSSPATSPPPEPASPSSGRRLMAAVGGVTVAVILGLRVIAPAMPAASGTLV